jgi:hypothetical protein
MAFTTGTATNYYDLLDKLRLYLIAQGWTVNNWAAGDPLTVAQLDLAGPGSLGGQQPKVSIRTDFNTSTNAYGWRICAYPQFNPARAFLNQDNNSSQHWLLLWNGAIDYWFYVNDRRFIVVAKIGVYYMSMYAGFFLPYALPAEYEYPYFIGASHDSLQPYTHNYSGVRSFADPGGNCASYLRRESMEWALFQNSRNFENVDDSYWGYDGPITFPYRNPSAEDDTDAVWDMAWSFFKRMRPLVNGKMPIFQVTIIDSWDETIPGVLDGVFATSGFNRVPEQVVSEGATNYRLFLCAGKNTPKHYFAVEEA